MPALRAKIFTAAALGAVLAGCNQQKSPVIFNTNNAGAAVENTDTDTAIVFINGKKAQIQKKACTVEFRDFDGNWKTLDGIYASKLYDFRLNTLILGRGHYDQRTSSSVSMNEMPTKEGQADIDTAFTGLAGLNCPAPKYTHKP